MDKQLLQDIKADIANWFDLDEERHAVLDELITALSAAQQELAEAEAELIGRRESNKRYHKQVCDKEGERIITRNRLDETEQQLAAAQAEVERWKKLSRDWQHEYFKAKAEWIEIYKAKSKARAIKRLVSENRKARIEIDKLLLFVVQEQGENEQLREQLAKAQAEVELLQSIVDKFIVVV